MHHPLAHLADVFTFHTTALQKVAPSLNGNDWLHRAGDSSHAYWLLGHLAYCRRAMLRSIGESMPEAAWEKDFGRGSKPQATFNGPPVSDLLADMAATGPRIVDRMRTMTEADLAVDAPRALPTGASRGAVLSFMSFHEAYHLGQISLLARSLGKSGLA